jgi:hypothetical protein
MDLLRSLEIRNPVSAGKDGQSPYDFSPVVRQTKEGVPFYHRKAGLRRS